MVIEYIYNINWCLILPMPTYPAQIQFRAFMPSNVFDKILRATAYRCLSRNILSLLSTTLGYTPA